MGKYVFFQEELVSINSANSIPLANAVSLIVGKSAVDRTVLSPVLFEVLNVLVLKGFVSNCRHTYLNLSNCIECRWFIYIVTTQEATKAKKAFKGESEHGTSECEWPPAIAIGMQKDCCSPLGPISRWGVISRLDGLKIGYVKRSCSLGTVVLLFSVWALLFFF